MKNYKAQEIKKITFFPFSSMKAKEFKLSKQYS